MKKDQVIVIYAMISNVKNYIADHTLRFDNMILPLFDKDKANAKHYRDEDHAKEIIAKLVNNYNRTWLTETSIVLNEKASQFGSLIKKQTA